MAQFIRDLLKKKKALDFSSSIKSSKEDAPHVSPRALKAFSAGQCEC